MTSNGNLNFNTTTIPANISHISCVYMVSTMLHLDMVHDMNMKQRVKLDIKRRF